MIIWDHPSTLPSRFPVSIRHGGIGWNWTPSSGAEDVDGGANDLGRSCDAQVIVGEVGVEPGFRAWQIHVYIYILELILKSYVIMH